MILHSHHSMRLLRCHLLLEHTLVVLVVVLPTRSDCSCCMLACVGLLVVLVRKVVLVEVCPFNDILLSLQVPGPVRKRLLTSCTIHAAFSSFVGHSALRLRCVVLCVLRKPHSYQNNDVMHLKIPDLLIPLFELEKR